MAIPKGAATESLEDIYYDPDRELFFSAAAMKERFMFISHGYKAQLAAGLILLGTIGLSAADEKKPSNPQEKPAAAPAKPAGHTGAHGPSTPGKPGGPATATHPGPPAGGAHTHPTGGAAAATTTGSHAANQPAGHGPNAMHPGQPQHTAPGKPGGGPATAHQPGGVPRPGGPGHNPPGHNPGMHPVNNGISGRPAPRGSHTQHLVNGNAIQRRPNGRVSDVHDAKRGMDIHHSLNGGRQVTVVRPDHSRIVVERGRPGYIERPYSYHGHDFARRSYYYHGHMYQTYYRGYRYRGVYINVYAPVRYYPIGFYGWAYHPWGVPVVFSWGWGRAPWYGYYGFYFAPYPVYPTPALWLTDYMISSELAAAYEAGRESANAAPPEPTAGSSPALTPEVKQQIADEVRNQIALENAEAEQNANHQDVDPASSGIARMLGDGHSHIFVAGGALDVVDSSGMECALSDGDVLQLVTPPPADATSASLVVLASKGGSECAKAATVTVALTDLQEMQNHMRQTIDQGMEELRQKQGQGGIPAAPPSATGAPADTPFAQIAPPPDPNDANAINQQLKAADQAEKEVTTQAGQGPDTSTPPPSH